MFALYNKAHGKVACFELGGVLDGCNVLAVYTRYASLVLRCWMVGN